MSKPKQADLIAACDSLLELKLEADAHDDKLDTSDDWASVGPVVVQSPPPAANGKPEMPVGFTADDWKPLDPVVPPEAKPDTAEKVKNVIIRHGSITSLHRRKTDEREYHFSTKVEVKYYDNLLPKIETVLVEEDIAHGSAKWYVGRCVTTVRIPGKPTTLHADLQAHMKPKEPVSFESGGAQAVPKIPFAVLGGTT